ncbi:MAG: NAD(P)H-hydrate dehydratase [Mogibacterium sp.]|nr:NAD(P)H-hydrate dehydratase [Mogibacterium sp.]
MNEWGDKVEFIKEEDIRALFPPRPADCHKGNFGYVALIGGSIEYSGAIRLAALANAAMRSGAGVATVAAPRSICPVIAKDIMEATLFPLGDDNGELVFKESEFEPLCARYDCIAIGMGIGNTEETGKAVEYLLTHYDKTLIIDADGLNAMSRIDHSVIRNCKARLVLTPHLKEFSRISGVPVEKVKADPVDAAADLARELDATVLLKGKDTVVAGLDPACENGDVRIMISSSGCPGMSTAGSGDVLSGILSALCVNRQDIVKCVAAGAYINGAAGELAQSMRSEVTMTSLDTANCVAAVIERIIRNE